jgi:hypothetical protein
MGRYSNRKRGKNRKQSFKNKHTGIRNITFEEDNVIMGGDESEMIGGDESVMIGGGDESVMIGGSVGDVLLANDTYSNFPTFGMVKSAFSNADCKTSSTDRNNTNQYHAIINSIPDLKNDITNKLRNQSVNNDTDNKDNIEQWLKTYFTTVFIPKGVVNIFVQNDDTYNEWALLTRTQDIGEK